MSEQWYFTKGNQHTGPVDFTKLKELATTGQIAATDLVWKAGMLTWLPASELPGLLSDGPPPVPVSAPGLPPGRAEAESNRPAGDPLTQAKERWKSAEDSLYRKYDVERAIADATEAIRLDPSCTIAFGIRAEAYFCKRDFDRAIADATEAIRLDPSNYSALKTRACVYHRQRDIHRLKDDATKAIVNATEAIRLDPSNAFAYWARAVSLHLEGDNDNAIADATEAIRLDPSSGFAYWWRGVVHSMTGKDDSAIADFTEAIRLCPTLSFAFRARAEVYRERSDLDRALADLTEAIRIEPHSVVGLCRRADIYGMKGDYDRAIADATEAIRIDPHSGRAYMTRAEGYRLKGDLDQTIADATEAIRLDPHNGGAFRTRAEGYRAKGDYGRAIADATEAARLAPSNSHFSLLLTQIQEEASRANRSRPNTTTAPVPTAPAAPTTTQSHHTHSKQVGDPDGCGPCTKCGHIFQMYFSHAVCPKCNHKMSREDAFFSCGSYPHSTPPSESTSGTTSSTNTERLASRSDAASIEQVRKSALAQAMLNQYKAHTGAAAPEPAAASSAARPNTGKQIQFCCPSCVSTWEGVFREGETYVCRCGTRFSIKRHLGEMKDAKALGFWHLIGKHVCSNCQFQGKTDAFIRLGSKTSQGRIIRGTERRLITMLYECPKCHCTMHYSFLDTYLDLL